MNFISIIPHNILFQLYINNAKKITNSLILSITESKNPPNNVALSFILAIAPSTPSRKPVMKTKIENRNKLEKQKSATKLKIEKQNIIKVARFGVTPILLKILATDLTSGLKILRSLNFEAISFIIPLIYGYF